MRKSFALAATAAVAAMLTLAPVANAAEVTLKGIAGWPKNFA